MQEISERDAMARAERGPDQSDPRVVDAIGRYWRKNVLVMVGLLVIWAIAGLGCGVVFADYLNQYRLGGFPLGFWFAQQGSIATFVVLVLVYAVVLNRLDALHHRELVEIANAPEPSSEPRR